MGDDFNSTSTPKVIPHPVGVEPMGPQPPREVGPGEFDADVRALLAEVGRLVGRLDSLLDLMEPLVKRYSGGVVGGLFGGARAR